MPGRKKKKKTRSLSPVFTAITLILIIAGGGVLYYFYGMIKKPNVELKHKAEDFFYIPSNSRFEDVTALLEESGILKNTSSFKWVAERKSYTDNVKPGRYKLKSGMSNEELVNLLRSGDQIPTNITFNNIKTLDELAGKVAGQIEPDSAELYRALTDDSIIAHYGFTPQTFISMFIPNTYEFYWNVTPEGFIGRMASEFKNFWTEERKKKARALGLTQSEVAALASIVQEETRHRDEMPKVARLYLNRLERGMKLQADPTVKFAAGDPEMKRIYFKHLKVESPYNTYIRKGLPPGPIAVPEKAALEAVLNAPPHNYIFMCAKPDFSGYHNFAVTLHQHNNNRRQYLNFLRQNGIR